MTMKKTYTPVDLELANFILANYMDENGLIILDRFGSPLYSESFILWAKKVIQWKKAFWSLVKKYWIYGIDWQLCLKAVYQSLRSTGKTVFQLRESFRADNAKVEKSIEDERIARNKAAYKARNSRKKACLVSRFTNFPILDSYLRNDEDLKIKVKQGTKANKSNRRISVCNTVDRNQDNFAKGYTVPRFYNRKPVDRWTDKTFSA